MALPEKIEQTLCVVDMQGYFSTTSRKPRHRVVLEILKARQMNMPIVILEYAHSNGELVSPTYPSIVEAVRDYDKVEFVTKKYDGGGEEFMEACATRRFPSRNVKFCGVNIGACIDATMSDIYKNYDGGVTFQLVRNASNCQGSEFSIEDSIGAVMFRYGVEVV